MSIARFRLILLALAVGAMFPVAAHAQGLTARPANPADVESIDAIVAAFYDVVSHGPGEPVDWVRDSTLYLADLRFKIVDAMESGAQVQILDHAAFADAMRDVSQGFVEREIHRVTHRFGPIAQVFSTYEWRRATDGPVGGRGINIIELFHDGSRWWISSAMWTGETPGNPIPPDYLPGA